MKKERASCGIRRGLLWRPEVRDIGSQLTPAAVRTHESPSRALVLVSTADVEAASLLRCLNLTSLQARTFLVQGGRLP